MNEKKLEHTKNHKVVDFRKVAVAFIAVILCTSLVTWGLVSALNGSVSAFPKFLDVSISPENVKLGVGEHQKFVAVVSGGVESYSFVWKVDGEQVGSGQSLDFWFEEATDFITLSVDVLDSKGNLLGYDFTTVYDPFSARNIYLQDIPASSNYVVRNDGTYTWAIKDDGQIVVNSTDDDDVLQYAINQTTSSGGTVTVMSGTYSASLTLKDNVTLVLCKGAATISVSIDSGADATLIDNHNNVIKEWEAGVLTFHTDSGNVLVAQSLNSTQYWVGTDNRTDSLANPQQTASYIIYTDGTTSYMRNGTTGQVDWSSTDASLVINNAIGNTTNGGAVYVISGTFTLASQILIDEPIIFCGNGNGTLFTVADGTNQDWNLIEVTNDDAVVKDFTVNGNKAGQAGATGNNILLNTVDNVKIINVNSYNSTRHGIYISDSTNCIVEKCLAYGSDWFGIAVTGNSSSGNVISKNYVISNDKSGLQHRAGAKNTIFSENIVTNNGVDGYSGLAVLSSDAIVLGNICNENTNNGILVEAVTGEGEVHNVTVSSNLANGNGQCSIMVSKADDASPSMSHIIVDSNQIEGTDTGSYAGILANKGSYYTITNNIVSDSGTHGITLGGTAGATEDVIIATNNIITSPDSGHGITITYANKIDISNNYLESCTDGIQASNIDGGSINDNNAFNLWWYGLYFDNVKRVTVSTNYIDNCVRSGIYASDVDYSTFDGNMITNFDTGNGNYDGIEIFLTNDASFTNNKIEDGGTTSGSNGIAVGDYCDDNFVQGNKINTVGGYGVAILGSNTDRTNIISNSLRSCTTGGVSDAGTNTFWGLSNTINNKPCEALVSGSNSTATTFVTAHGLASTATHVTCSFNTTTVSGYSWASNSTHITVTVAGTSMPAAMTCYADVRYVP